MFKLHSEFKSGDDQSQAIEKLNITVRKELSILANNKNILDIQKLDVKQDKLLI